MMEICVSNLNMFGTESDFERLCLNKTNNENSNQNNGEDSKRVSDILTNLNTVCLFIFKFYSFLFIF